MEGQIGTRDELMLQRKPDDVVACRSLDETRRIVLDVLAGQPVDVYLFGSWARDEAGPTSDIDVAVDVFTGKTDFDEGVLTELRARIEDSTIPYRVDVVDLRRVTKEFRDRVLREGIRWNDTSFRA